MGIFVESREGTRLMNFPSLSILSALAKAGVGELMEK